MVRCLLRIGIFDDFNTRRWLKLEQRIIQVLVADDVLEQDHTCEQCGTKFTPASVPEGLDINATMSMGQAFHVPPVAQESDNDSQKPLIVGGIIVVILIVGLLLLFLR